MDDDMQLCLCAGSISDSVHRDDIDLRKNKCTVDNTVKPSYGRLCVLVCAGMLKFCLVQFIYIVLFPIQIVPKQLYEEGCCASPSALATMTRKEDGKSTIIFYIYSRMR